MVRQGASGGENRDSGDVRSPAGRVSCGTEAEEREIEKGKERSDGGLQTDLWTTVGCIKKVCL